MADTRIMDLTTTVTSFATGDYIVVDRVAGTVKYDASALVSQTDGLAVSLSDPNGVIILAAQTQPAAGKALSLDLNGSPVAGPSMTSVQNVPITLVIDGGGSPITTGIKFSLFMPWACTITRVTLLADVSGSIVLDIWKDTYGSYPPTVADTITASAKPTLSSALTYQDSTLTGWTKSIAALDTLRFKVDSASTLTQVTVVLEVALI